MHLEEAEVPHHTVICEVVDDSSNFNDLIASFVVAHNITYPGFPLTANDLRLICSDGKKPASLRSLVASTVCDKDDVIVKIIKPIEKSPTTASKVMKALEKGGMPRVISPVRKAVINMKRRSSNELVGFTRDIEIHMSDKAYRVARILCEKCLTAFPDESYVFYGALARIKLANKEYDAAISNALLAVSTATKAAVDANVFNFTLAEALFNSVDRCDEADEILEKMLFRKFSSFLPKKFTMDVRVLRAECLFNLNQHEAAANLVNEHMHWDGAEDHMPTLIAYTRFAMTYNKVEEPVRAMLKAIVIDQNNGSCRKMLADLLSSEAGYVELMRQVPPTPASAAAYAFLATAVKECSAMIPCIKLLGEALSLRPQSASFALNLAHALEIM